MDDRNRCRTRKRRKRIRTTTTQENRDTDQNTLIIPVDDEELGPIAAQRNAHPLHFRSFQIQTHPAPPPLLQRLLDPKIHRLYYN
uniref:Uncharacterized protein n=1 Tax=Oryza punctata TaxID=4537 RepID=A0A0E0MCY1_ORYPU